MSHNFSLKHYEDRTLLILLAIIFGFISSKALISIGTGVLLLNFIFSYKQHKLFFVKMSALPILAATFFFFLSVSMLFNSPSLNDGLLKIWFRLPWLIIPISIAAIKKYKNQHIYALVTFLIFIASVSGIIVLINYFFNYEFYQHKISLGQHIPTPINHIRFSLILAFSGVASLFFAIKNNVKISPYDRFFFSFTSVFIFILLHILAVRSGVVTYYIALIFLFIYFSFNLKKWWLLPLVVLIMGATPYLAYKNVGSFKNKVDYMMYDFKELQKGNHGYNADARRFRALEISFELIKKHQLIGCGVGNIEATLKDYYTEYLPEVEAQNQKIPHNQLVYTLLEMGLIGLLVILFSLFTPLISTLWFKNPLYISFWLIIMASCMVENTFEGQLGLTFYLVFASLLLKLKPNE